MRKTFKFMSALLTMAVVAMLSFTLTSCSDDDDEPDNVVYTCGISTFESTSLEFISEISTIENAYKSALGISQSPFTKHGSVKKCDDEVIAACNRAYDSLKEKSWSGNFTYTVSNVNTGKVVYEQDFKKSAQ